MQARQKAKELIIFEQLAYGAVGGTAEALMESLFVKQLSKLIPLEVTQGFVKEGTNNLFKKHT